jgi:hypothetical protein
MDKLITLPSNGAHISGKLGLVSGGITKDPFLFCRWSNKFSQFNTNMALPTEYLNIAAINK